MHNSHRNIAAPLRLSAIFIFIIIVFNLLRFVNVSADFPQGVTWSLETYTDEGIWLSGAMRQYLTGSWYMEGDLNLAVNHPVLPLIMLPIFKIFGMNLMVARLTIVIFYIFTIALVYWLVKEYVDRVWALLAASILSVNYSLFAYSRMAILEIPMVLFIMLACVLMRIGLKRGSLLVIVSSSFFITIAILTKATAVFAIPLLWYMIVTMKGEGRIRHFILFTLMSAFFYTIYYASFALRYLRDYNFFVTTGVAFRFSDAASEHVIYKAAEIVKNCLPYFKIEGIIQYCTGNSMLCRVLSAMIGYIASFQVDKILYPAVAVIVLYLIVRPKRYIFRNNLFLFSIIWIVLYLALICMNSYFPPRYFLPIIIPIAILTGIIMNEALAGKNRILTAIMGLILTIFFTINGLHIIEYISHPEYSFISMCEDIKKHVESDKGHNHYIGGNFANSLSLQTHIPSVNEFVMIPIGRRLERYKLGYYVSVGDPMPDASRALDKYYDRRLIKKYDVFHNYWQGKKVFFFALDEKK